MFTVIYNVIIVTKDCKIIIGLGMRPRKEATISQYIEFVPVLIPRPHSQPHSQSSFPASFPDLIPNRWPGSAA